ncbi:Glu/Leu/Phe/Val dehydrogenase [Alicyclobacillaceae bacterium I2511]|jgi:leucine dehydrogenase|nr:Glu/Leu/Phe/Val dehydrogenase [Alicyclobacillaceae bacterium I2511]
MELFSEMAKHDYEQMVFCADESTGLKAVIVIHDTTLGPALGGCRMWNYASESDAIVDALRLARGMTYKAAVAGLNLGGGKTVVFGDPKVAKSEGLFRSLGRFIQGLNGRYITAEDVGTSVQDMDIVHMETDFVTGTTRSDGSSGNPSPVTALGVFRGLQATAKVALGSDDLSGKTVAIQGLGSVGYNLAKMLHKAGAQLIVTDINEESLRKAVAELNAKVVRPSEIFDQRCDIFAPCALGAIINDDTIERLHCAAIAGAANNQLAEDRHGDLLYEKGIVYAPDYVINAAGLINVAEELRGYNETRAMKKVEEIYDIMLRIYDVSRESQIGPHRAANQMAENRIAQMKQVRSTYLRNGKDALQGN